MIDVKFKELVHFIVHECRGNPAQLGAVRLNKVLWLTDMYSYQLQGKPITGERYVKRRKGPVPATILATLKELEKEEKIIVDEPQYKYDSRKFVSIREPNIPNLLVREREFAKGILDFVLAHSADEISDQTHEEAWEAAAEGEEIPLYATLVTGRSEITDQIIEWASQYVSEENANAV